MQQFSHDTVVVLDFGAQYSQLIARRVRELHVYSQIVPYTISAEDLKALSPKGIIFSGGPASVSAEGSPRPDADIFKLGIPILGICYGLQVMSVMNGGEVRRPDHREYGLANLDIVSGGSTRLLRDIPQGSQVWMSHGDSVVAIPEGFVTTASTPNCPYTVIENGARNWYGVQFHPEVVHSTEIGRASCRERVYVLV
jgi:GMP synthase (glutamine-hydrolysing)